MNYDIYGNSSTAKDGEFGAQKACVASEMQMHTLFTNNVNGDDKNGGRRNPPQYKTQCIGSNWTKSQDFGGIKC